MVMVHVVAPVTTSQTNFHCFSGIDHLRNIVFKNASDQDGFKASDEVYMANAYHWNSWTYYFSIQIIHEIVRSKSLIS